MKDYSTIKSKVEKFSKVTTRPMFGFQCFSINKKFFVGFSNKNSHQIIVRLPKEKQELAKKTNGIKPFSHGAKMGWIEINSKLTTSAGAMKWITYGYQYAKELSKSK